MFPVILLMTGTSVLLFIASRRTADPRLRTPLAAASILAMLGAFATALIIFLR